MPVIGNATGSMLRRSPTDELNTHLYTMMLCFALLLSGDQSLGR